MVNKELNKIKVDRAKKWFAKVPNAENIDLETQIQICNKVAWRVGVLAFSLIALEFVLLAIFNDGALLYQLTDEINELAQHTRTRAERRGTALLAVLWLSPLFVLPVVVTFKMRNKWILAEANKYLALNPQKKASMNIDNGKTQVAGSTSESKHYAGWTMQLENEKARSFGKDDLQQMLKQVNTKGRFECCLMPQTPVPMHQRRACSLIKVCPDTGKRTFRLEINVMDVAQNKVAVTFGKAAFSYEATLALLTELVEEGRMPCLFDWEVLEDHRIGNPQGVDAYRAMLRLMPNSGQLMAAMNSCLNSPQQYFNNHQDRYEERGFEEEEDENTIIWFAMVDEMIEGQTAVELDWKTDREEFAEQMQELVRETNLELKAEWLDEAGEVPTWCRTLDEKWAEHDYCVGCIDINSDSYVLFVSQRDNLEMLEALSLKVDQRIMRACRL